MKATVVSCGLPLLFSQNLRAVERTFIVVTNAAVLNHWPAADGFIGTADDVVSSKLPTLQGASPNSYGTYRFIVTAFSNQSDPLLPPGNDTATFVLGSATIDTASFLAPDVPLLKSVEFPGHGAYSVKLTNPRAGTYTRRGNSITFSTGFDFEGQFLAGPAKATDALADGVVVLVDAKDFGAPDLSAVAANLAGYINTVALPFGRSMGASGLLCGKMNMTTSGSLPGTTGGFPPLKTVGVVLAMEFATAGEIRITSIQVTPGGVKIQWNPLTGTLYTVEATGAIGTAFTALAPNLEVSEYLDTSAKLQSMRFYRVHAQ